LHRLSTALQEPLSLAEQLTRVAGPPLARWSAIDRLYIWTLSAGGDGLMVNAQAGFGVQDWEDLIGVDHSDRRGGRAGRGLARERAPAVQRGASIAAPAYRLRPGRTRTLAWAAREEFSLVDSHDCAGTDGSV
jgi:hypothetical protein